MASPSTHGEWNTAAVQPENPHIAHLQVTEVTAQELADLPEYSCSIPTGTTIGKRWKKDLRAYDRNPVAVTERAVLGPEWVMGEYVDDPDPELIGIRWTRIKVTA